MTGASSGIGRAVAIACSSMGAVVILTGRDENKLKTTRSLMEGANHLIIRGDLAEKCDIDELVSQLPIIDGVVHCAGIGHRKPAKFIDEEDLKLVLGINFNACVLLQAALLSSQKLRKGSSVVFVASKAANFPSVGNSVYSASKGAVISYAKCLALELAPRQIRVNTISPAMVWTELILQDSVSREDLEEAEKSYPLKRYGQPEDVANLVVYLLSEASCWMTGTDIEITGGARVL